MRRRPPGKSNEGSSWVIARPAVMRPSAVRSQARKVRSLANESCTSGSWPSVDSSGGIHRRPSWRIARSRRVDERGSVTPVSETGDRGERRGGGAGRGRRRSSTASSAASTPARMLYVSIDGKAVADLAVGEARAGVADDARLDGHLVLDDQAERRGVDRAAVGARRARARRPGGAAPPRVRRPTARTASRCGTSSRTPPASAAPTRWRAPRPAPSTGTRSSPGSARSSPRPTGSRGSGPGTTSPAG